MTILIVEDELQLANLYEEIAALHGFAQVRTAGTLEEALALLNPTAVIPAKAGIDCVLSDGNFPQRPESRFQFEQWPAVWVAFYKARLRTGDDEAAAKRRFAVLSGDPECVTRAALVGIRGFNKPLETDAAFEYLLGACHSDPSVDGSTIRPVDGEESRPVITRREGAA